MKKQYIYMLLCMLALFTLSCSSDDGVSADNTDTQTPDGESDDSDTSSSGYSVSFTAEIAASEMGEESKVSDELFEEGDIITVYNQTLTKSYNYSSESFTSDDPFKVDRATNYAYVAIYPADTTAFSGSSYTYDVATDQSTQAGLDSSDLLIGVASETNSVQPALQFSHAMSSVIITVTSDSYSNNESGVLTLTAKCEASCDFESVTFGAGSAAAQSITPYSLGNNTFMAIIAPQDATELSATFSDVDGGISGVTTNFENFDTFESGYQYDLEWDIAANTVSLTGVNIAAWESVASQDVDYDKTEYLPTPTLSVIAGNLRTQIEYSLATNDSRVSSVILTVDGTPESYDAALFTLDESDMKYKYIVEDSGSLLTQAGTHSVTAKLEAADNSLSSIESNSATAQVYDLTNYTEPFRSAYYNYLDSSGATLLWTPVSEDDSYATFQVIYNTSTTATISASDTQTTLSGATAGGTYITKTTYSNIEGLPSVMLDPCEVYDTLTFSTTNVGTALAKDGTVFNNIFDNDARLVGDYSTYSDSNIGQSKTAFGSIKHTWDSEVTYTNSNNMCDGYHAHGTYEESYPDKYVGVDGCVTFDLQANYYLAQYAYSQRRSSSLYTAGNVKSFTIYGAADLESGETLDNKMEEYNKMAEDGTPDFDNMPGWVKILDSAELTRQGTTTGVNLATSTDANDMQDYQEIVNGHHFAMDNSTTAVRYIRIQIHSTWDNSTSPSPQMGEFYFWGSAATE